MLPGRLRPPDSASRSRSVPSSHRWRQGTDRPFLRTNRPSRELAATAILRATGGSNFSASARSPPGTLAVTCWVPPGSYRPRQTRPWLHRPARAHAVQAAGIRCERSPAVRRRAMYTTCAASASKTLAAISSGAASGRTARTSASASVGRYSAIPTSRAVSNHASAAGHRCANAASAAASRTFPPITRRDQRRQGGADGSRRPRATVRRTRRRHGGR